MLLGRSKLALAAFLQPVLNHIKINNGGWRLNRGLS